MMFDAWPAAPEIVVSKSRAGGRQSTFWTDTLLHRGGTYRVGKRVTGLNDGGQRAHRAKVAKAVHILKKKRWQEGAVATDLPPGNADKPTELADLQPHQCHWPCSGEGYQTLFCGGDAVAGYSYCARHCRMAYVPERRISREQFYREARNRMRKVYDPLEKLSEQVSDGSATGLNNGRPSGAVHYCGTDESAA